MERLWPSYTAAAFLQEMFGSRDRLLAAAGDDFTALEVTQLYRRPAERISEETWSDADLALLDEAEDLMNGVPRRYGHIVVDEAQDLSPMQLRAVGRRSATGSMTIVGDIAQSTGLWSRDSWDELLDHLPDDQPRSREELRYGYRVPRQVFDMASRLLPIAAPDVQAPQVVRDGPAEPGVHRVETGGRAERVVEVAMDHAAHGRSVGIICPASCRQEIMHVLTDHEVAWKDASTTELGPGVNLVSPQEVKGLEFDAVVLVEPEDIVAEDQRGHRLLYVAMTRTTRYLDIVCVGSPLPLGMGSEPGQPRPPEQRNPTPATAGPTPVAEPAVVVAAAGSTATRSVEPTVGSGDLAGATGAVPGRVPASFSERVVNAAAEEIISMLEANVAPTLWEPVLGRVIELLPRMRPPE